MKFFTGILRFFFFIHSFRTLLHRYFIHSLSVTICVQTEWSNWCDLHWSHQIVNWLIWSHPNFIGYYNNHNNKRPNQQRWNHFHSFSGVRIFHIFQPNNAMINSVKGGSVHIGKKTHSTTIEYKGNENIMKSRVCVEKPIYRRDDRHRSGRKRKKTRETLREKKTDPKYLFTIWNLIWTKIKEKSKFFIRRNARLCRSNFEPFFTLWANTQICC